MSVRQRTETHISTDYRWTVAKDADYLGQTYKGSSFESQHYLVLDTVEHFLSRWGNWTPEHRIRHCVCSPSLRMDFDTEKCLLAIIRAEATLARVSGAKVSDNPFLHRQHPADTADQDHIGRLQARAEAWEAGWRSGFCNSS